MINKGADRGHPCLIPLFSLKPYLHGDILPGKFLKIEQAIEKSSCKSEIFLFHIVRPLTQLPCLEIEHALFSQESGTLQLTKGIYLVC